VCRGRRAHFHRHHHLPAPLHKKSHGLVLLASSRSQGWVERKEQQYKLRQEEQKKRD
jgi:hypothetical protein